ncbi:MAG: hypothetical protein GY701_00615 [Sulfitobacter sp.]|nr:hypothetical protein [Sulfitobacter sp.]
MLISVGSLKGSPGATTFAALLARMWPAEGEPVRMLLEADVDGGSLAASWHEALRTAWSPGVVEFAAAARGESSMVAAFGDNAQPAGAGVGLVPGVPNRATMSAAISSLGDTGLAELARSTGLTVADIGRFRPPVAGLVRRSQLSVIVCHPTMADAQLLQPMVAELANGGARVGLVTVGDKPYGPAQMADVAGVEADVVWSIPVDGRTAAMVNQRGLGAKALLGSRLGRAVRTIASDIAATTATPTNGSPAGPVREVRGRLGGTGEVSTLPFGQVVNRG